VSKMGSKAFGRLLCSQPKAKRYCLDSVGLDAIHQRCTVLEHLIGDYKKNH
jgi:hypothetical protein